MKRLILIVALLLAPLCVQAAEKSSAQADTENIKVSTAFDLISGLSALGARHEELIGSGNNQKVVAVPFNFSADTLWAISDNLAALRKVISTYQETIKAMQAAAEAKNGGPLKPAEEAKYNTNGDLVKAEVISPKQKALNEEIEKVFASERPTNKLFRIKRGDLCLGGSTNAPSCPKDAANKISPTVIMQLNYILEK